MFPRLHNKINLLVLSIFLLVSSCKRKTVIPVTDIKKWERSVINIECQELRYTPDDIDQIIATEKAHDKISSEEKELERRGQLGRETNPVSGTAIYLTDNGKKYLVTARHVIFDPQESKGTENSRLFKDISIRTPYDYFLKRKVNNSSIPSTGYGATNPFYLSDDITDIGIISLQASLTHFLIKTLEDDGYVPINLSDIDQIMTLHSGDRIAAIGYPDFSKIGVFQKRNDYQSNVVVLPVSTFGNVAMAHEQLAYFIGDITVYPGNSGGPVIRDDKLIGIVSKQVLIPLDRSTYYSSRGTLAKVIRAEHIIRALRKLQVIEADKAFR